MPALSATYNAFFFDPEVNGNFRYFASDEGYTASELFREVSGRPECLKARLYSAPNTIDPDDPSAVLRTALHVIFNQPPIAIRGAQYVTHSGTYFVLGESSYLESV